MGYQLFLGDCLEVMRGMEDKSVDAIITDPPYGINLGNHRGASEKRMGLLRKSGGYEDTPEYYDAVVAPAIREAIRIAKRVMVFGVPPSVWKLPPPDAMGGVFIPSGVGRSRWGFTNLSHCLMYGSAPNLNKGCRPTTFKSVASAEHTGHPTTKPIAWMRWAVSLGSVIGETVFDPFMGSGTTGVACVNLGRNFIGCEINPEYYAIAERRISQAQPPLFTDAGSTPANNAMQLTALRSASGGN